MLAELPGAGQRDPAEEGGLLHRRREVRADSCHFLFSRTHPTLLCSCVQSSDGFLSRLTAPQRAVGVGVQVLADGEGELRAALPLPGVLRPHLRRRPGEWWRLYARFRGCCL